MLHLANAQLRLDLLDPVADRTRLGTRYCWGGYVWQVWDLAGPAPLPLVRGPEWPAEQPVPFNGQGLPESFRHRTLAGVPLTWRGDEGLGVGIGSLRLAADRSAAVVDPCAWEIVPGPDRLVFRTSHAAAGYACAVVRTLALDRRTLTSHTALTNLGPTRLGLEWFAHPFFAIPPNGAEAVLPAGTTIPENPGFALAGDRLRERRRFAGPNDGHMDYLGLPTDTPLLAALAQPGRGLVDFRTSFVPDRCIVWGNDRTFSLEPYLVLDLAPGETRAWSLQYTFPEA